MLQQICPCLWVFLAKLECTQAASRVLGKSFVYEGEIAHLMSNLWITTTLQQETAFQVSCKHGEAGKLDSIRLVKSDSKMLSTHPVW